MKTSNLTGAALDWAVCKCAGLIDAYPKHVGTGKKFLTQWKKDGQPWLRPSTDWAQGGPIIEREGIAIYHRVGSGWCATVRSPDKVTGPPLLFDQTYCLDGGNSPGNFAAHFRRKYFNEAYVDLPEAMHEWTGPTPLIAAMRCYVASKLGAEVSVPEELL